MNDERARDTEDGAERTGELDGDVEREDSARTRCPKCGHEGKRDAFRYEEEEERWVVP